MRHCKVSRLLSSVIGIIHLGVFRLLGRSSRTSYPYPGAQPVPILWDYLLLSQSRNEREQLGPRSINRIQEALDKRHQIYLLNIKNKESHCTEFESIPRNYIKSFSS